MRGARHILVAMINTFECVERPVERDGNLSEFAKAVLATLTTGNAVAVPLGDEPYVVVRNRVGAHASHLAKRRGGDGAKAHTARQGDAVLVWLERKS